MSTFLLKRVSLLQIDMNNVVHTKKKSIHFFYHDFNVVSLRILPLFAICAFFMIFHFKNDLHVFKDFSHFLSLSQQCLHFF